jgi:hypothetical protein
MTVRLSRFLVLGCGLLLALPPAWCCYPAALPRAPQSEPSPPACCQKEKAPAPSPLPLPARCPCYDRNTVASASPEKLAADLSLPAPLAVVGPDSPCAGSTTVAAPTALAPAPPLHVLQCVWLC